MYYPGNGKDKLRLETWEIMHLKKYNPNNRFVGLSPIESLAVTLVGDLGMRKTNSNTYVEQNGQPPSILAFKEFVNNDSWTKIKEEVRESAKENKMMTLRGVGDGVTWLSRAMSNKDAEFIATLQQNMTDVFNRLCPGLLAMLDAGTTYSNADKADDTYRSRTKWPMLETIAQKITSDILPAYGLKLKGEFDDPRQTDIELELKQQEAFERSHTIAEIRKEYYEDEPLGDGRDDLMVMQVNSAVGDGTKENPPQPPQQPNTPAPQQEAPEPDETTKAALDDLARWRKMALRGKEEKAKSFKSTVIPVTMMRDITAKLPHLSDKDSIDALFTAKMESLKPKPTVNPVHILQGIEAGIRALELQKG
jgi:hypothetical protein